MKKMNMLFDEMIHITSKCAMHLRDHWNKIYIIIT